MNPLSPFRMYLLRAGYLLLAGGLGSQIWPQILHSDAAWELMHGVVISMLGALSALSLVGLRYPLSMLPMLFFEMAWKAIWLVRVAFPLWSAQQMDAGTTEVAAECLVAVIFPVLIPWDYVFQTFVKKPGDSWGRRDVPQRTV